MFNRLNSFTNMDPSEDLTMIKTLTKQSSVEITLPCFRLSGETLDLTKQGDETVTVYGVKPVDAYSSLVMTLPAVRIQKISEIIKNSGSGDCVQKLVTYLAEEGRYAWLKQDGEILLCHYDTDGSAYSFVCPVAVRLGVSDPDVDILTAMLSTLK